MPAGPGTVAPALPLGGVAIKPTDFGLADPLDQATKALALRSQLQLNSQRALTSQQQAAQSAQALEAGRIEIQQKQQDLKDQQAYGDALRSMGAGPSAATGSGQLGAGPSAATGIDQNAVLMKLMQNPNISGKFLQGYMGSVLANRKTNAEIAKDQADAASAEATSMQKRNEEVFGTTAGLLALPHDQRAAAYPAARQRLITAGHLDPAALPEDYEAAGGDAFVMKTHLAFGNAAAIDAERKSGADLAAAKADAAHKAAMSPFEEASAKNAAVTSAPNAAGLTPSQASEAANQQITRNETARHNLSTEANAKLDTAIAAGRLAQEKLINGMKYGPGTQEYWVQQLQDNPDSISEMPAELRSSVGQKFTAATRLPLPKPASAANQTTETAARNALDNIAFVQDALKDPEIAANIGPIMGRLGNAEQAGGVSVGLSPHAAQMAQEVRTRMRYLVFQEGKAILGGRMPEQLMQQLEASSPNVKMDAPMLQGALTAVGDNANGVMENVDKQRFGGKARPAAMRGVMPSAAVSAPATDMIKVQIPGQPPGQIHASQRAAFLKQYPNAVVQ